MELPERGQGWGEHRGGGGTADMANTPPLSSGEQQQWRLQGSNSWSHHGAHPLAHRGAHSLAHRGSSSHAPTLPSCRHHSQPCLGPHTHRGHPPPAQPPASATNAMPPAQPPILCLGTATGQAPSCHPLPHTWGVTHPGGWGYLLLKRRQKKRGKRPPSPPVQLLPSSCAGVCSPHRSES